MATRTRGNIPARQTPSHLPQTGTIQNPMSHPSSSKINSFAQKQIPTHHLDSTNVSKQQSKRPTPGDTAHKPTTTRRSTFHELASPSTTKNTSVSSNPTLRTSTFSSKTASMQKTFPARKPSSLYTRPVGSGKKRFIYVKKQDIGSNASTTKEQLRSPPQKVEAYDVPQPEQNLKDQESSINETKEEAIGSSNDNEAKPDHALAQEDIPEPISNSQTKAERGKDVDIQNDKQDTNLVVTTKDVSQVVEAVRHISSEPLDIDEINSSKPHHENVADNSTSEVEEMNKEQETAAVSDDKKEEVGTVTELFPETKETEEQEMGRETENLAAKVQAPRGKKESVVSNDVIEETASKLRKQKKNKVKALAGAFETVISQQDQRK